MFVDQPHSVLSQHACRLPFTVPVYDAIGRVWSVPVHTHTHTRTHTHTGSLFFSPVSHTHTPTPGNNTCPLRCSAKTERGKHIHTNARHILKRAELTKGRIGQVSEHMSCRVMFASRSTCVCVCVCVCVCECVPLPGVDVSPCDVSELQCACVRHCHVCVQSSEQCGSVCACHWVKPMSVRHRTTPPPFVPVTTLYP